MIKKMIHYTQRFFTKADGATKAKIGFVSQYFSIFGSVLSNILKAGKQRLVYIDLFCGAGMFGDGTESVPINVLKYVFEHNLKNVRFIFNDYKESQNLRANIEENTQYSSLLNNCLFLDKDANTIDVDTFLRSDDIVFSYIDSFGYQLVKDKTLEKLIARKYSDCVFFLNIQHFVRFLGKNPSEEKQFLKIFGSEELMQLEKQILESNSINSSDERAIQFVSELTAHLKKSICFSDASFLPLFIRESSYSSEIQNLAMVLSKSKTGINGLKNQFAETNSILEEKPSFDKIISPYGALISSVNYQLPLEISGILTDYSQIEKKIPCDLYVTRSQLLAMLDDESVEKHGFVSPFPEKVVTDCLRKMEKLEKLDIKSDSGKRKNGTFSDSTHFRRIV